MGVRSVSVQLLADVGQYVGAIERAGMVTRDFKGELADAAAKGRGNLDAVASQALGAGLALTGAFAGITATAGRFDQAMSSVSAATLATAADMDRLREAALQAGADTAFSATDAAEGIEELAKAGVSTADILGGGLAGALDLAAAGQIAVGEAAETAASAMTQFGLAGGDVTHIADLLAAAAGKAQGGVGDMAQALKQSGLVAAQTGLTIEEATGTLAAFASAGLIGSDAGTSFRTMLLRLAAPVDKSAEMMAELGINAFNAQGEFIGMANLAGVLQGALSELTDQQRQAALAQIFGQDAIRSASIVYQMGAEGIQDWITATDDAGFAAETAARKLDNLMGDVEALTGSLETMAIQSSGGATGGLRLLTQFATEAVNSFGELPPVISNTAVVLAGLGGASLLAFSAWVRMRTAAAQALTELREVGPAGKVAATGLQRTVTWVGRATAALVALQLAGMAIDALLRDDLNPQIEAFGEGLAAWGQDGQLAGEAARLLGADLENVREHLQFLAADDVRRSFVRFGQGLLETVVPGLDSTETSLAKTRERVAAFDAALSGLVTQGRITEARGAFMELAESQREYGITTEQMMDLLPTYAGALETAAHGGDAVAASMSGIPAQMSDVAGSAEELADMVDELTESFTRLFDLQMNVHEATIAFKEGLDELKESLGDNSTSLSFNSEQGRENLELILGQVQATKDLFDAKVEQNGVTQETIDWYQGEIDKLAELAESRGFDQEKVEDLLSVYRDIQDIPELRTEVNLPFIGPRTRDVDLYHELLEMVDDKDRLETIMALPKLNDRIRELEAYRRELYGIPSLITTQINQQITRTYGPGANTVQRWGGIVHAQRGQLVPAHIATSPTVLYGERATGMEAFVPMHGERDRSMSILQQAASWYGARVTTGAEHLGGLWYGSGAGGGSGGWAELRITGDGSARANFILGELRHSVKQRGGNVQVVIGSG